MVFNFCLDFSNIYVVHFCGNIFYNVVILIQRLNGVIYNVYSSVFRINAKFLVFFYTCF
jgi:hypothetical protein